MKSIYATLVAVLAVLACSSSGYAETYLSSTPETTVVVGKDAPYVELHAGQEFVKYATMLTGKAPVLLTDDESLVTYSRHVVAIGTPESNSLVKRLAEQGLVDFSDITWDGFIAKTMVDGDATYLVLGGGMGRGTLYAVYHYLQRFCHMGFFLDGERVPSDAQLVWDGVNVASNPFFKFRKHIRFGYGHLMVRKYTCHWWKWPDFKYNIDWWAKLKFNEGDVCLGEQSPGGPLLDETIKEVFADRLNPDDFAEGGTSSIDIWPPEYRMDVEDKAHEYCTKLGLYAEPYIIAQVPLWFRDKHPEIDFDDNELRTRFARVFIKKCMDRYPANHHIYGGWEFWKTERPDREGEWIADMDALGEVFSHMIGVLREYDPKAMYRSDWGWNLDWCFNKWDEAPWSLESTKQFFDKLPAKSLFLDDYACDIMETPPYLRYDYYLGQNWSFGTFWNAGVDTLNGDFYDTLAKTQEIARNPKGQNCVGIRLHQENQGTNAIYRQFVMTLGWNPLEVSVDGFLSDYALRRYGPQSQAQMVMSLEVQVEASALNTILDVSGYGGGFNPLYRYLGLDNSRYNNLGREMRAFERFREALRLALVEKERQAANDLYNRDIVDQARMALGQLFDYYFIKGTVEQGLGNTATAARAFDNAVTCLDWIEKILSTRPDFSMQETIDYAMSVSGTSERARAEWSGRATASYETPEAMIKGGSQQYANCECFEQTYHFYKPRVLSYIARLRGEEPPKGNLWLNWINGPTEVPEEHHFKGTTVEAVSQAYEFLSNVDDAEIEYYVSQFPGKLAGLWRQEVIAERAKPPAVDEKRVILRDGFEGPRLDSQRWDGSAILTEGVAMLLQGISHDFESDDWSATWSANYVSHSAPHVRVTNLTSRSAARLYCSNNTLQCSFDGERDGVRVRGHEEIGTADGRYHVYRLTKKGNTVTVLVDDVKKASFELPPSSNQWRLTCSGNGRAPLFVDWIILQKGE